METKEVSLTVKLQNDTFHYSLGDVTILKLSSESVSEELANVVYDHMCGVFGQGVELGLTLREFDQQAAVNVFNAIYGLFEDTINMGLKASSAVQLDNT